VSITRTNSSVAISAIVSLARRLAVPALTNRRSKACPASLPRSPSSWSGAVMSSDSMTT